MCLTAIDISLYYRYYTYSESKWLIFSKILIMLRYCFKVFSSCLFEQKASVYVLLKIIFWSVSLINKFPPKFPWILKCEVLFPRFYENVFTLVSKVMIFCFISCDCGGDWVISGFFYSWFQNSHVVMERERDHEVEGVSYLIFQYLKYAFSSFSPHSIT